MTRAGTKSLQGEHPLIPNTLRKQHTIPSASCGGEMPLSLIPVPGMAMPSPPKALSKNNQAEADTEHGKF